MMGILVPAALAVWRWAQGGTTNYARFLEGPAEVAGVDAEMESRIEAFCGDCHAVPYRRAFTATSGTRK